jgi:hypothetical protein
VNAIVPPHDDGGAYSTREVRFADDAARVASRRLLPSDAWWPESASTNVALLWTAVASAVFLWADLALQVLPSLAPLGWSVRAA